MDGLTIKQSRSQVLLDYGIGNTQAFASRLVSALETHAITNVFAGDDENHRSSQGSIHYHGIALSSQLFHLLPACKTSSYMVTSCPPQMSAASHITHAVVVVPGSAM